MYYIESPCEPATPYPFNIVRWEFDNTDKKVICFNMHNHAPFEVIVVLAGELLLTCSGEKIVLRAGDSVMINPFELHSGVCDTGVVYLCLTVNIRKITDFTDILGVFSAGLISGKYSFPSFCLSGSDAARINFEMLTRLHESFCDHSASGAFLCYGILMEYLAEICPFLYKNQVKSAGKYDPEFMRKVAIFLSENYANDIGTPDICKALHYDISCFCHKFKKNFGMCFSNYLCMYRINVACENYRNKGTPISIIAERTGFSDYNYFSRCFKKYTGVSPKKYFENK